MQVYLIDGTYELFRCFFGAPSSIKLGRETGATRALLRSLAGWLKKAEVTHVAVAFDHVIESFRNDLFDGYKTSEGIAPTLFSQFELAERATKALGIVTWPMIEFEADDALASGAKRYAAAAGVKQVLLCSPDKDLAQCVRGKKVVGWDRWKDLPLDETGVVAKFGVPPHAIPDLLALVGDTADGIPGLERWGMKSASTVLAAYGSIDAIPDDASKWKVPVRGAEALAVTLREGRTAAALYRKLATLREDVPLKENLADLEWKGAHRQALEKLCEEIGDKNLPRRIDRWR